MPYSVIVQNRDGVETHYPFPTVTEILEVLHRPDLTEWYYDVTIEGISKLFQKNASTQGLEFEDLRNALAQSGKSPHSIGHFARARGTSGHKVLEKLARGLDPGKVTPSQEWIVRWWNSEDRHKYLGDPVAVEQPVTSFKHKYSGTPDLVFNDAIVDLKTTNPDRITPERLKHWGLQLDGYDEALTEQDRNPTRDLYVLRPPGVLVQTHYYGVFSKLADVFWEIMP